MKGFIILSILFLTGCRTHVHYVYVKKEPKQHGELAITGGVKDTPGQGLEKTVNLTYKLVF